MQAELGDITALRKEEVIMVGEGPDARAIVSVLTCPDKLLSDVTLVWLGGYKSDMEGSKALALEAQAMRLGTACLRFDYSGHGRSGGAFRDGTISRWLDETLSVISARVPNGRLVLCGSSMGGWITLRTVQSFRKAGQGERLAGIVLIAPAPDFTSELIEPELTAAQRKALAEQGYFEEPSDYGPEPYIYTRALIEDGRQNRVLDGIIETGCPVHILQGMADPDVPWTHAMKLVEHLPSDNVVVTLIRDGDHRLSRPEDLDRLAKAVEAFVGHGPAAF